MITVEVDPRSNVATLKPEGMLNESDFETVKGVIDPYIDEKGRLDGIVIQARQFPGWESFKNLSSRMDFARDQQNKVSRVAVATDSALPDAKQVLSERFPQADVRTFRFDDLNEAERFVRREM